MIKRNMELIKLTIKQIRAGLIERQFSAEELTRVYLDAVETIDVRTRAYLTVCGKEALAQARVIDDKIAAGADLGLLAGAPCAIKDNILIKGLKCTAGSKILENYIAPYDATVVEKLKKEGAIFLGKTNMDEFAMGSSTENSAFGPTRNPCDEKLVPGGSSGGSAAAVAAEECVYALGSDTGGSIRQPASFCGVVGLKPTYGAVSRYGLMATASSLDQIGPLAQNIEDCRLVFDAIKSRDKMDSTSVDFPAADKKIEIGKLRIGLPREYFAAGLDSAVEKSVRAAAEKMEKAGAKIEEISLPRAEYVLACYYIIMASEVSANLARFDGVKYGFSAGGEVTGTAENLMSVYLESRRRGFGDEVRRRVILGTYSLSSGYYDAYYARAQKVRALIVEDFRMAFEKVDLIFSPVAPTTAFKIGEKTADPVKMYLSDIYTASVNLAGLPALAMPCGLADNLPVGLQIIGPRFSENLIFEAGQICENLLK